MKSKNLGSKIFTIVALTFGLISVARSQNDEIPETRQSVRRDAAYEINADGTATLIASQTVIPGTTAAVNTVGQYALSYQEGMSNIEILEAYTQKRDGRRVEVTPDKIITQVPPAFANSPIFTDMKVKRIIFPDFTLGDRAVFRYKRTWLVPLFPGHFFDAETFPRSMQFVAVSISVKHPKAYPLQFHNRDLEELPAEESGEFVTRKWTHSNRDVVPEEPGAVSPRDRDPALEMSSFRTWDEIAQAYDARARDKAAVTPEIRKLADEITTGIEEKRLQAQAIHAWVADKIRYVAVYLGAGGYVPHAADTILENRYGDCKDYTTILGALLSAKGIENEPVIIHAGNRFKLPDIPTPSAFNHAITYLPEFNLYLDATARKLPFGQLVPLATGKPALHTRSATALARTPAMPSYTERAFLTDVAVNVSEDGTVTGTSDVRGRGALGRVEMRQLAERMQNPQEAKKLSGGLLVIMEGLSGTAEIAARAQGEAPGANGYSATFALKDWINLPGPGAVRAVTGVMSPVSIRFIAMSMLNQPLGVADHVCVAGTYEERGAITFPTAIKLSNYPRNLAVENASASYEAQYALEGHTLHATRTLKFKHADVLCTPQERASVREILEAVRRDVSAQVIYE